jgi:ribosomal protein S27E
MKDKKYVYIERRLMKGREKEYSGSFLQQRCNECGEMSLFSYKFKKKSK